MQTYEIKYCRIRSFLLLGIALLAAFLSAFSTSSTTTGNELRGEFTSKNVSSNLGAYFDEPQISLHAPADEHRHAGTRSFFIPEFEELEKHKPLLSIPTNPLPGNCLSHFSNAKTIYGKRHTAINPILGTLETVVMLN